MTVTNVSFLGVLKGIFLMFCVVAVTNVSFFLGVVKGVSRLSWEFREVLFNFSLICYLFYKAVTNTSFF